MAGYSSTPLIKKLGIKENLIVYIHNGPDHFLELLGEIPKGVTFPNKNQNHLDFVHLFVTSKKELTMLLNKFRKKIKSEGMIWVSWPKKSSKVPTDITEDTIREICLPIDLVDIKVCAVDDIWSGLKLVIRKEKRIG
jgi:hypothetical protein